MNGAEVKYVFDDGRVRYIYGNAVPLRNPEGRVRGCVAAFADVTPLKEAEESLRRATEQLRIVTDSMAAPVTRCIRDLQYLWVSKTYSDWLNRPTNEIIDHPILDIIGPQAFERLPHAQGKKIIRIGIVHNHPPGIGASTGM